MNKAALRMADPSFEKQVQLAVMPNPFSERFTIRFNLSDPSDVIVTMYDSKGSLVKKVQDKTMSKGKQALVIDGSGLVNGIYLCEVIINQQRILRKMILQK